MAMVRAAPSMLLGAALQDVDSDYSTPRVRQSGCSTGSSRTPSPPTVRLLGDKAMFAKSNDSATSSTAGSTPKKMCPPPGLPAPPAPWSLEPPSAPAALQLCAAFAGASAIEEEEGALLSLGTRNHPHACAGPCRYVKRKGGCREGAQCRSCHLCFWRRPGEGDSAADTIVDQPPLSKGTLNHPHKCGPPCRYARRKGGCRDGVNCTSCHACLWQREVPAAQQPAAAPAPPAAPVAPSRPVASAMPQMPPGLFVEPLQPVFRSTTPPPGLEGTVPTFGDAGATLQALIFQALTAPTA